MAVLLTFLLGAFSAAGPWSRRSWWCPLSVVATLLLSVKPRLHALVRKTSKEDVFATLKFLLVVLVVLPQLPNRTMGPLDVLNPYKVGLMVVLIAGISFTGYVAILIPALAPALAVPLCVMAGGGFVASLLLWRHS